MISWLGRFSRPHLFQGRGQGLLVIAVGTEPIYPPRAHFQASRSVKSTRGVGAGPSTMTERNLPWAIALWIA
jgi:hypothetical protein